MQDFNKLMRAANQSLKNGEIDGLAEIYGDIESIMKTYPTLFPDDSFDGKTKASNDIIDNREAFNQIANDTSEWAALAKIAAEVNQSVENIGARRLYTVLERVFEELSFSAPDKSGSKVTVDLAFVEKHIGELSKSTDLSRYVL